MKKVVIGIDEVGRGPLAGPVTIGIVMCQESMLTRLKKDRRLPPRGKDSKKLSPTERTAYAEVLKQLRTVGDISYTVIHISNKVIDTRGISFAIRKGISQGLKKLGVADRHDDITGLTPKILLDGGLKAPLEFTEQKTIIKGDEKEQIIAWASILAKVSRDALMVRVNKKFSQYNFDIHKGYGTAMHRRLIVSHGLSPMHRKSFCKKLPQVAFFPKI